jgi:hypothetical protein
MLPASSSSAAGPKRPWTRRVPWWGLAVAPRASLEALLAAELGRGDAADKGSNDGVTTMASHGLRLPERRRDA